MDNDNREEQRDTMRNESCCEEQRLQRRTDSCGENRTKYIVRRLIPKECARLQGFPPDWCDDVPHSDSAEYKLWGNGIALCSLDFVPNIVRIVRERKEQDGQGS